MIAPAATRHVQITGQNPLVKIECMLIEGLAGSTTPSNRFMQVVSHTISFQNFIVYQIHGLGGCHAHYLQHLRHELTIPAVTSSHDLPSSRTMCRSDVPGVVLWRIAIASQLCFNRPDCAPITVQTPRQLDCFIRTLAEIAHKDAFKTNGLEWFREPRASTIFIIWTTPS